MPGTLRPCLASAAVSRVGGRAPSHSPAPPVARAQGKRNNESYFFDVGRKEWKIPEIAGTPPHPRSHHTANLVEFDEEEDGDAEKKIFIIGG